MTMAYSESAEFGGRVLTIETGEMAKQAGGAAFVHYGDSRVLVTACSDNSGEEGADFFPLTVDYQEKTYAVGKVPGGFIKREGRPHEREVLYSRLIDRPIRPLFPKGYNNKTQVVATVVSADQENDTAVMAMIGASAALHISDIPFQAPIAGVRVGMIDGQYVANPHPDLKATSKLWIFMAASRDAIVMVEGEAQEATDEEMLGALQFGMRECLPVIELQERLRAKCGAPKREFIPPKIDADFEKKCRELLLPGIKEAYAIREKQPRYAKLDEVKAAAKEALGEELEGKGNQFSEILEQLKHDYVREEIILGKNIRIDGRGYKDIRPITCRVGLLPRTHGSALFTRGETQALAIVTLGTADDAQRIDDITGESLKKFNLHYNFPPYSVGEVKPLRSAGRREIGHGNLAERSIAPMLPDAEAFPYSIRIVSEILESNGSSSMASVCGGTMALLDAGVPLKKPVAGIAMGLVEKDGKSAVLSDILGDEDHLGDMDCKVTGTADGITGLQMDLKRFGISEDLMRRTIEQAREGRLHILGIMKETLSEHRDNISPFAPRIMTIKIDPSRIGDVIGSGGKTIRKITEQTGTKVEVEDDGTILISSTDEKSCLDAIEIIKGLTEEPEVGKIYKGVIRRLADFGAFVEIIPGVEGLLHISEWEYKRVERMEDVCQLGDEVEVKLLEVERNGKLRLSRKELLPRPEGWEPRPAGEGRSGGGGGGSRGGRDGGRGGDRGGHRH